MSGAPSTAEALGCAGFDFLVVDMEHVPIDTPQMIEILRTIAGTPAQAIVRLPWNDMVMVKRALDAGAQTVLLPVRPERRRSAARRRVHALSARGHPRRRRDCIAAAASAPSPTTSRTPHDELCVIVQIETLRGARAPRRNRRGARRRLDLHRPGRPVGVDGHARRHRQSRRAGEARRTRRSCAASSASPAASSARRRRWSRNSSNTATRGSRSVPT